jgi:hypothetical protein
VKIETLREQTLVLPLELRRELKNPLGTLIKGSPKDTMRELTAAIQREKPVLVISVGDEVSRNMLKYGIKPNVMIVDNKVMREETKPIETTGFDVVKVRNPAGTMTPEAWRAIKEAFRKKRPTRILVDGEEDLLTLAVIMEAPEKALVVYGQPREGIVVTKANRDTKQRVGQIVRAMQPLPQS